MAARQRQGTAVGTSKALEKRYLRLTAAPTADSVRPPAVLERALALLKDKWLQVWHLCVKQNMHSSIMHNSLQVRWGAACCGQVPSLTLAPCDCTNDTCTRCDSCCACLQGVDYVYACEQLKSMRQVTERPEPVQAGSLAGTAHVSPAAFPSERADDRLWAVECFAVSVSTAGPHCAAPPRHAGGGGV